MAVPAASPAVDPLAAIDAQFLYWDSDNAPMCMGNICIFEGAPLFDSDGNFKLAAVRNAIESRLHLVPRYRRKVLEMPGALAHPVLVDDPDFDIENHVKLVRLPPPGDETQLKEAFARAHEGMLDRRRPLWEITFVEGLEDGRIGMVQKIHHAPFDGATTVDIMDLLFDQSPELKKPVEVPPWEPAPPPDPATLLQSRMMEQATTMWSSLLTPPAQPLGELMEAMQSVADIGPLPETSLNQDVGPRRRFEWVSSSLSEAKEIRSLVPGSTVNDAMLAAIAGGLRELLRSRGENVDELVLHAMIPVSLRSDEAAGDASGNLITAFVAPLPLGETDGVERLRRIHASTKELKEGKQALGIHMITQSSAYAPPALMAASGRMAIQQGSFMNLTITNVPGPRHELYLLGAKMLALNPMVPIGNRLTLNIAIESYVDNLVIGLSSDADAHPDLDVLATGIRRSVDELLEAARA
jgi:diacylglycerol O-acyltransferase / wax synthase